MEDKKANVVGGGAVTIYCIWQKMYVLQNVWKWIYTWKTILRLFQTEEKSVALAFHPLVLRTLFLYVHSIYNICYIALVGRDLPNIETFEKYHAFITIGSKYDFLGL